MTDPTENLISSDAAIWLGVVLTASAAFVPITTYMVKRFFPLEKYDSLEGDLSASRKVGWGPQHVIGGLIVYLLASLGVTLMLRAFLSEEALGSLGPGAEAEVQPMQVLAGLGAQAVIFATVAVYAVFCAARSATGSIRQLGFVARGQLRAVSVGVVAYMVSCPGIFAAAMIGPWVLARFGHEFQPQPYEDMLLGLSQLQLKAAFFLAVIAIPFLEELLFRGFLQPVLVRRLGAHGGVVLTAAIFGILHGVDQFFPIFVLALVLGGVMHHTRRLGAVFAIHALHNGMQIVAFVNARSALDVEPSGGLLFGTLEFFSWPLRILS